MLALLKIRPHQSAAALIQGFTVSQWAACTGLSLASACLGSILFAKLGLTLKTYQSYWSSSETRNDVVEIKGHRRTYAPDSDVVHATGALQAHCAQIRFWYGPIGEPLTATQCQMRISRLCTWHMVENGCSTIMHALLRLLLQIVPRSLEDFYFHYTYIYII